MKLNVQTNEVGCSRGLRRLIKTAAYLRVHDEPIVLSYRASTKDGTTIRVCNDESRTGIIAGGIGDNDNDNGASRLPRAVREAACRLGSSIIKVASSWNDPPGVGFRPTKESQLERGESRIHESSRTCLQRPGPGHLPATRQQHTMGLRRTSLNAQRRSS